ncbi:hydroxyacid dehydrogenase [Frankia sp. CNm7]|uniref:Hydroxyacid dehydrogenase n=1 Tax=Frankia nepalensis TaxID=1836974 RepID=A0A937REN9_9ACTN|nr:NAD(P)-dependent oxidoreductase [Frankia nepalensis]MBL7500392.1 hydroxyacid dehydrogenase [Frankia nepalensis]MBL7508690.1 hydroxyacid dehydrogenase [Frankia nepalensis]MBL7518474.1 hydroxyacid dehydrogenase [Frankia nepalensis]MBL7628852.1 hydroxyacid dehydrogenase [Frankia nepalensis]
MPQLRRPLVVAVPTEDLREALASVPATDVVVWDLSGEPPRPDLDVVVVPYMSDPTALTALEGLRPLLVQSQSIGYEGVSAVLPAGLTFSNAAGVHETSTAELAIGLMIASQRRLPALIRAQADHRWAHAASLSLADSRVLVVGQGGVGRAVVSRLRPFEVDVVRVAATHREDAEGVVWAVGELPGLLPDADVVVLAVPLNASTVGLVNREFLATMRPGALLVNVARGQVVVTEDLVEAVRAGQIRAALDVVDPEPLPPEHALWDLDEVLLTPHVGGHSAAMRPRVVALLRRQLDALSAGAPPHNVVIPARTTTPPAGA